MSRTKSVIIRLTVSKLIRLNLSRPTYYFSSSRLFHLRLWGKLPSCAVVVCQWSLITSYRRSIVYRIAIIVSHFFIWFLYCFLWSMIIIDYCLFLSMIDDHYWLLLSIYDRLLIRFTAFYDRWSLLITAYDRWSLCIGYCLFLSMIDRIDSIFYFL